MMPPTAESIMDLDTIHSAPPRIATVLIAVTIAACSANGGSAAPAPTTGARATTTAAAPSAATTSAPTSPSPAPSDVPALALLWERSGPTQAKPCCTTWWPAIDPISGDVWVADSFANQFWIFAPDGTFRESWGTPGAGEGAFDFSAHRDQAQATGAIAFAPDGSFFVADDGNHRIQAFDAKRHLVRAWGRFGSDDGQFLNPFGIATDGKLVFVADDDRGDIQVFKTDGTFVRAFGPKVLSAGLFIALDPQGRLLRSDGEGTHTFTTYDPTGTALETREVTTWGDFVAGIAVGPDGRIFANVANERAETGRLYAFDTKGMPIGSWSTGGETIAVDPSGKAIYLASAGPYGTWTSSVLRKYALPASLASVSP